MDTEMWYGPKGESYLMITLVLPSSLNEDMQKALDYIQYPNMYGITVPERFRIFDVDSDPYWESPKIKVAISMEYEKKTIESMITALKCIEKIINTRK